MLTFHFAGKIESLVSFTNLEVVLTICLVGIAVALVLKRIAKRFKI